MKSLLVLVLLVVISAASHAAKSKFKYPVQPCARDDPQLSSCFKKSLQELFDIYTKFGFPELGLEPNSDPYFLSEIMVSYLLGENKGTMTMINSTVIGARHLKVKDLKLDFGTIGNNKIEADVEIELPKVFAEGLYDSKGVFIFPIKGGGYYNVTMTDISGSVKVFASSYMKKGVEHMQVDKCLFAPKIGSMVAYASNLYTGNKDLNNAALQFVNQNWRSLYEEMLPYASEAAELLLKREGNRVLSRLPLEDALPHTLTGVHTASKL